MTTGTKSTRAEATRARLAEAAITCFAAKGFHGTSTRDIADAAGISPTALYGHHASKEELLFIISLAGHQHALSVVRAAASREPDPMGRLIALVHDFAMHHAESHMSSRVVNYELEALSSDHRETIVGIRRQITATIRSVVDDLAESGCAHIVDRRLTARALTSLCVDISRWYHSELQSPEDIASVYALMAVNLVNAQPPASDRSSYLPSSRGGT